ncbi:MAG: hypothetical protein ACRCR8_07450 [Snodgrassella alvi]
MSVQTFLIVLNAFRQPAEKNRLPESKISIFKGIIRFLADMVNCHAISGYNNQQIYPI